MKKRLFNQYRKKIFYTLGVLFLLNLFLMLSDRGILIGSKIFIRIENTTTKEKLWVPEHYFKSSDINWGILNDDNIYKSCVYWMGRAIKEGRGREVSSPSEYVCPMTARLNQLQ